MLKELRCNKLVQPILKFKEGLNALVGPNDATNSIGKSSVLMLIDFALAGDDFLSISNHVIENVGEIIVEIIFEFNNELYHFTRSTSNPTIVNFVSKAAVIEEWRIENYRLFLQKKYNFPEGSSSFRSAVNPFFRIWGKDNYNPNKPLNSFPNEPYLKIRSNILKLFSYYKIVQDLEGKKIKIDKKRSNLNGIFSDGYIQPLNKNELKESKRKLEGLEFQLEDIKSEIKSYSISIAQLINDENLELKSKKDCILDALFVLKNKLRRVEDNLKYGGVANKKYFERLEEYFPEVNSKKVLEIENFHSGVTKILKAELKKEKQSLEEKIYLYEKELEILNGKISECIRGVDKPELIVDKILDLSIERKKLNDQIVFRELKDSLSLEVKSLADKINVKILECLNEIEHKLNYEMSVYIDKFYDGNPVSPEIILYENRYEFNHNDDSGTGKSFANMIAMDMSFLKITYLPSVIHDSFIFKNIEVHAVENIVNQYSLSLKQSFISIDELGKYNDLTQCIIKKSSFLELGASKLAFNKSWKSKTNS